MLHVGGARSALFNWVFAKRHGGSLTLRIEDTDASRNRPEWTQGIIDALSWLGITPEQYEGPYFQSQYTEQHTRAQRALLQAGRAYYCDCTREAIGARTGDSYRGYDGYCRDRGLSQSPLAALRFRTPDTGETVIDDVVRGTVTFAHATLEDFVIARGDGSATFLLANVVDDATMGITHVIRAEEHLSNAPKQQLIWQALGLQAPIWAHVSILVDQARKKLSKRRNKVALEAYRDEGFLPDAMRNYLMLLGWSPGEDREIVPWKVIESEFELSQVTSSAAYFDTEKLRAFNGEYIRALELTEFISACQPWLMGKTAPWQPADYDPAVFAELAPHAQSRIAVLSEIVPMVDFAFLPQPVHDEQSWNKAMKPGAEQLIDRAIVAFANAEWEPASLKSAMEQVGLDVGLKLGKAQAPVRVAVTGRTVGLPLFESLAVLGRDRTLQRLAHARAEISPVTAA